MPLRFGLYKPWLQEGFIPLFRCVSEFAGMDLFSNPERDSANLQRRSLFAGALQGYLSGADNLAELYQIRRRKTTEGRDPVSDGEAVCHVSANLNTEATCVTTVALPDAAAWQLYGRPNASATPASASPAIAGHSLAVNGGAAKVGKKRSRASRRAPTTLLNTDTSNFRAMVQQFTGISNSPFANVSSADLSARNSPPKPFAQDYYAATPNNSGPANLAPPLNSSPLPILPFELLLAENMNNPFLVANFFGNKGNAHGFSEG